MFLNKKIVLIGLILGMGNGLAPEARSATPHDAFTAWKEQFLRTTEISEGEYRLVSGPVWCIEGELRVEQTEVGLNPQDGDATIMMGSIPLVTHIAREPGQKNEPVEHEGKCTWHHAANFGAGFVDGLAIEQCDEKTKNFLFELKTTPTHDIEYTVKASLPGTRTSMKSVGASGAPAAAGFGSDTHGESAASTHWARSGDETCHLQLIGGKNQDLEPPRKDAGEEPLMPLDETDEPPNSH